MADSDDPFQQPGVTSLRPRPGLGRPGNEPPRSAPAATSFGSVQAIPESARAALAIGLNPLVQVASPLLLLAGRLRGTLTAPDVPGLRRHALEEIRSFEERGRAAGLGNEVIMPARYALCAALDEAVLSTPWGVQSEWAQHPLLVELHREAWGGEKFFEMLDRIMADPRKYLDLMELQYLCLAFGFAGNNQAQPGGLDRLAEVQRGLYRKIREHREAPDQEMSLRWRGLEDRRNPLVRYVPWWVIGAAVLAILAVAYTAYSVFLGRATAPVQSELAKIGLADFAPVVEAAPPPRGPTLKQLLAADEQAGAVTVVEEANGRTIVTPLARNLFASGSATVNPEYLETLQHIAKAINQVAGRVMVVGHTDNQPLRSLQYQNNYELSRERAVSVVKILEAAMDSRGRLSWNGVGSDQPRYPESDPANRERNRRVEIVHVRAM